MLFTELYYKINITYNLDTNDKSQLFTTLRRKVLILLSKHFLYLQKNLFSSDCYSIQLTTSILMVSLSYKSNFVSLM